MRNTASAEADPSHFFRSTLETFHRAALGTELKERRYSIAGRPLKVLFAGAALLEKIGLPLEHLRSSDPRAAEATIYIWDSSSTRTRMLERSWSLEEILPNGMIRPLNDSRFFACYKLGMDVLSLWDRQSQAGILWVQDAAGIHFSESGSPLRYLLNLWLQAQGLHFLHAAGVGYPEGGILIPGRSGRGKTTTAISCLRHGLGIVGEDYVILEPGPIPLAHSVYNSAKFTWDSLDYFPELQDKLLNPHRRNEEKALLMLWPSYKEQLLSRMPLRAVVIPEIAGGAARLEPVTPAEVLKALAPSTLLQLQGTDGSALLQMKILAESIPGYKLLLSPKLGSNVEKLKDLLRGGRLAASA